MISEEKKILKYLNNLSRPYKGRIVFNSPSYLYPIPHDHPFAVPHDHFYLIYSDKPRLGLDPLIYRLLIYIKDNDIITRRRERFNAPLHHNDKHYFDTVRMFPLSDPNCFDKTLEYIHKELIE